MHRALLVAILLVGCSKAEKAAPPPEPPKPDCAPLAEQAKTDWTAAAIAMSKLGAVCSPHAEPVVAAMVSAMDAQKYDSDQFAAVRELLDRVPLSEDQNQRIMDATARLEKHVTAEHVPEIKNQARKCIHNRERRGPVPLN